MPNEAAQDAWVTYRQAIGELYQVGGPGRQDADLDSGRLDDVLGHSERLGVELAASMMLDDPAERELAGLKLLAAAAYDLAIAADIAAVDDDEPSDTADRAAANEVLTDPGLRAILDAPVGTGWSAIASAERGGRSTDPAEAAAELRTAVSEFLAEVPEKTAKACLVSAAGMLGLTDGLLHAAAVVSAREILTSVPEHTPRPLRRAAGLVVAALAKLVAAIGGSQLDEARAVAYEWLAEVKKAEDLMVAGLFGRLYEIARIEEEVDGLLKGAAGKASAADYNAGLEKMEELLARYDRTMKTVTWVLRAVSLVKVPLLGAVPWGPGALGACYLGAFGYIVCSGGDYVDWYRLGRADWLDRVPGCRSIVRGVMPAAG